MTWPQRIAGLVIGTIVCLVFGARVWFWILVGSFSTIILLVWKVRRENAKNAQVAYGLEVEDHLRGFGVYEDLVLPIQASDIEFLKGFHVLCRAGFSERQPALKIAQLAAMIANDYAKRGREYGLGALMSQVEHVSPRHPGTVKGMSFKQEYEAGQTARAADHKNAAVARIKEQGRHEEFMEAQFRDLAFGKAVIGVYVTAFFGSLPPVETGDFLIRSLDHYRTDRRLGISVLEEVAVQLGEPLQ